MYESEDVAVVADYRVVASMMSNAKFDFRIDSDDFRCAAPIGDRQLDRT